MTSRSRAKRTRRQAAQTHECPAPGCEERVAFRLFACRRHWYALPFHLRHELNAAWRRGDFAHHARIRDACVDFLARNT